MIFRGTISPDLYHCKTSDHWLRRRARWLWLPGPPLPRQVGALSTVLQTDPPLGTGAGMVKSNPGIFQGQTFIFQESNLKF